MKNSKDELNLKLFPFISMVVKMEEINRNKEKSNLTGCNKCATQTAVESIEKIVRNNNLNEDILKEGINQEQLDEMIKTFENILKGKE